MPILQNTGQCDHMNLVQMEFILNQMALIALLNKQPAKDIITFKKSSACMCDAGTEACFDQVLQWINNLSLRSLGPSKQFTQKLVRSYTHSKHNLVTDTGFFTNLYSEASDSPLCSLDQGSTFAVLGWAIFSCFLFNMITKKFKGVQFKPAIINIPRARIEDIFIDDATLQVIHKINKDKPIRKAYKKETPQIILAITTFLQFTTLDSP